MNVSDNFDENISFNNITKLDLTEAQVLEAIGYLKPLIRFDSAFYLEGQQEKLDNNYVIGGVSISIKAPTIYKVDLESFASVNRRNVVQIMNMKFDLTNNLEKLGLMKSDFRFEDKVYKLIIDSKQDVFLIIENRQEEERKEELLKARRKEEKRLETRLMLNGIEDLAYKLGFRVA